MNILQIGRVGMVAVLAAMALAFAPSAYAVCAGQYPANHVQHGEMPCYPQNADAAR